MSPIPAPLPILAALGLAALALVAPLGGAIAAAPGAAGHADPAAIDLAHIERAVAGFVAADPASAGAAALPLDARLRLARCRAALRLAGYGTRRDSVRVECPDMPGWRVFVRVSGAVGEQTAAAAPVVLRGEAVSIAVAGPGFTVARSGEALEPGAPGQWIRVRTAPTAAPLRARVSGPGTVELLLP